MASVHALLIQATLSLVRVRGRHSMNRDTRRGKMGKNAVANFARRADANISFNDLVSLLLRLGFEQRIRGSHQIFFMDGVEDQINIQRDGNKAKKYQIREVRRVITRYGLGGAD